MTKKVNKTYQISYWLAFGQRFYGNFLKKLGFCSFAFEFREVKLFKPIWTFQNQTTGFYLVFNLNKTAITWFFAWNSSLVLPGCQPCLRLMGAEKYRTSDQREEISEIQCKVSMHALTALLTLYKSSALMRSSSSIIRKKILKIYIIF